MTNYGVITEQGDLGLGWNPLDEKDNTTVNEAVARQNSDKQNISVINEDQKNK